MEQQRTMEYKRQMIYFSIYHKGVRTRRAGYAGLFVRERSCTVQIYFRSSAVEGEAWYPEKVYPVYAFEDGYTVEGEEIPVAEGMAAAGFETETGNFLGSGRDISGLEAVYLEGIPECLCGGRVDGQECLAEEKYTVTDWMNTVTQVVTEAPEALEVPVLPVVEKEVEPWSLSECMEKLPQMRLPFDGRRRSCCRMTLEDMERLPKEWQWLKNNHFLLHGYYEYHHLLLAKLSCRYGEQYVIGVPGEYTARSQYMAENFGFSEFCPLEQGKRSFGYWYYYLDRKDLRG